MSIRFITTLFAALIFAGTAHAQLFKRMHAKKDERAPKAILVQLFTYQNRVDYFQKHNNKAMLEILERDRDSVMSKMIADFNNNFSYCPVYYYIDTNYQKVLNKDFDGVLLNEQLKPVQTPVVKSTDNNYFIVFFGNNIKGAGDNDDSYTVTTSNHKLVVCDDQLNKLEKPLPDGTNNRWPGKIGYQLEGYYYTSPKFDISYKPYAAHFSAKLLDFYGYYPYQQK